MAEMIDDSTFDPTTFNPHEPSFIKNPYPVYAWFRKNAPVSWVENVYKSYFVYRYEDVKSVLTGTDLWIKNPEPSGAPPPGFRVMGNKPSGVFTLDNPRHDEVRGPLDKLFAKAIEGIEGAAGEIAAPLLAKGTVGRRFELIEAFARPLPSRALAHALGVSQEDWFVIDQWVTAILLGNDPTRGLGVMATAGTTTMALRSYYDCLLPDNPPDPRVPKYFAPVAGKMVDLMATEGEASSAKISRDEVIANAVTMSIAGYYSTTFLIGTGTLNLLSNPDALVALREGVARGDDALLDSAILEMLRYDGPVQLIDRYAAEDTELVGVKIPKNQKVTVVVGSANHDEAVFPNPEKFDITRNAEGMLSFGEGMHRCLGEPLFNKVAPVAFKTLLSARPKFKLSGMPQWQTDPYLRAVSNLPLEFEKMDV